MSTPQAAVVDQVVEAYNAGDINRFLACFTEGVRVVRDRDTTVAVGRAAMRALYQPQFDAGSRTELAGRVAVGRHVADQARVTAPGEGPADYLIIYTVEGDLVARVDFLGAEAQAAS